MSLRAPITARLADADAERVRRNHEERIAEIQALPILGSALIEDVTVTNNGATFVQHKLGREPRFVWVSPIRVPNFAALTVGVIVDAGGAAFTTANPIDRSKVIQLGAFGFGTTVVFDVVVF